MAEMSSTELSAVIKNQIYSSSGYLGGEITEDRRRAMDYYLGNPLGNEVEGRSKVVSSEVQDVIETAMPDLMQIFGASDKTVRYEPVSREDEEYADQSSDYANYIWNVDNQGFAILHDWIKDSLLQINGIVKIWWDTSETTEVDERTGQTEADILRLMQSDDEIEILEKDERWAPEAVEIASQLGFDTDEIEPEDAESMGIPPEIVSMARVYDIRFRRTISKGRIRVANVPPEEFLISRRAVSVEDAPFCAHWTLRTVSELIEDGYDREQIESLPEGQETKFNEERVTRFQRDDEWPFFEKRTSKSEREIQIYECYTRVDYDGDGISELRKITVAGPGYEVLRFADGDEDNVEIREVPFCSMTPIRMPHKFFGRSLAELVEDLQLIKTSLWRQLLDNAYAVTNARAAISDSVDIDDFLNNRVGTPIRVNGPAVVGQIEWQQVPPIGAHIYPALEYADTVRELRTGITRVGQGLDPDALNSTARGMNMLLGRTQQRLLLIAQVLSLGVKDAFRKILRLMIAHQDKARTVRLRNQWVDVDPRSWNAEMDVTVNVGLGHGTQEQQMGSVSMLLQIQEKMINYQGGITGPFVFPHHVSNALEKWAEAAGLKTADAYFHEIDEQEGQKVAQQMSQPKPDPELQKIQAKGEVDAKNDQMKASYDAQKTAQELQFDMEKLQLESELRQAEIISREKTEIYRIELEHQREMLKMGLGGQQETDKIIADLAKHSDDLEMEEKKIEATMMDSAEERRMKAEETGKSTQE